MIPLGVLGSARVSAGGGIEATLVGTHIWTTTSAGTVTFKGVPLGDAVDRTLIVLLGVKVASGSTSCSMTVAGTAATIDVKNVTHVASAIGRVDLPSSVTTGDVVITTGGSWYRQIWLYSVPGTLALIHTVAGYRDTVAGYTSITAGPLTTPAAGLAFSVLGSHSDTSENQWTLSGLPEQTDVAGMVTGLSTTDGTPISSISATRADPKRWLGLSAASYSLA